MCIRDRLRSVDERAHGAGARRGHPRDLAVRLAEVLRVEAPLQLHVRELLLRWQPILALYSALEADKVVVHGHAVFVGEVDHSVPGLRRWPRVPLRLRDPVLPRVLSTDDVALPTNSEAILLSGDLV